MKQMAERESELDTLKAKNAQQAAENNDLRSKVSDMEKEIVKGGAEAVEENEKLRAELARLRKESAATHAK